MKKLLLAALLLIPSIASAMDIKDRSDWDYAPSYGYTSPGVNLSTYLAVATTSNTIFVSTYPASVFSVVVGSAGSVGSTIELFDASVTTLTSNLFGVIDGVNVGTYHYNTFCASGVAVGLYGTIIPKITVNFSQR